jgi:uncharacterized membrane protein
VTIANGAGDEELPESETGRVEAFSDGVMAVIITIMALELRAPVGGSFADLRSLLPALLVYVLSFAIIGTYWNNHHQLLRAARRITGTVMWTNLVLLFWLSLLPVLTEWTAGHYRQSAPAAIYGVVALGAAVSFMLLSKAIIRADGKNSRVAVGLARDYKGKVTVVLYAAGTALAFVSPYAAYAFHAAVPLLRFVPDRRFS